MSDHLLFCLYVDNQSQGPPQAQHHHQKLHRYALKAGIEI